MFWRLLGRRSKHRKAFHFVSSIGVNGALTKEKPFDESSKPALMQNNAISKFEAEVALRELFKQSSTELVIVRPHLFTTGMLLEISRDC